MKLLTVLLVLLCCSPLTAQVRDDNSGWDSRYRHMGFDLFGLTDFTFLHDTIVAYGGTRTAGGHRTPGIAYYDGNIWHPMGLGTEDYGMVNAVIPDGRYLYVGGSFRTLDGKPINNFARWDWQTHSWESIDNGVGGRINTMLRIGNTIYIGGSFDSAGPTHCHRIVSYDLDSHQWDSLRASVRDEISEVMTLATDSVYLYAGGIFDTIGGILASSIARWHLKDKAWDAMGLPHDPHQEYGYEIDAIYPFQGGLLVGGSFDSLAGINMRNIARWDGTTWSKFGDLSAQPRHFETYHDKLLVTGYSSGIDNIWRIFGAWNGNDWQPITSTTLPDAIHTHNDKLYATGGIWADSNYDHHIAYFEPTDSTWRPIDVISYFGSTGEVDYIARVGHSIYTSGSYRQWQPGLDLMGSESIVTLEVFENGAHQILTRGGGAAPRLISDSTTLYGIDASLPDSIHAIHSIQRFDRANNTWSVVDTFPHQIEVVMLHDSVVYAYGNFYFNSALYPRSIAQYDLRTHQWTKIGQSPNIDDNGYVTSLTFFKNELYIAGSFGNSVPSIFRYDSVSQDWKPLLSDCEGPYGRITAMAASDTKLYVGGVFESICGRPMRYVAQWDGVAWDSVGSQFGYDRYNISIDQMAANGNDLTIAGFIRLINGMDVHNVARWDGKEWHALGWGTNGDVLALATDGPEVFVGGYFTAAGDVATKGFAHWSSSGASVTNAPISTASFDLYPNPAINSLGISLRISHPQKLRFDLYNTAGVRLATLFNDDLPQGDSHLQLDLSKLNLANEYYFLSTTIDGVRIERPLMIMK